jgi:ComF family protein
MLLCAECRRVLTPYPGSMRRSLPALDEVRIAYVFGGPLRSAVHQLKYRRARRVAVPLGQLMATSLAATPLGVDALVPIPLHAERLAQRGYNQAAEIAHALGREWNLPVVDGLARVRATEQQAKLNSRERAANVQGAFRWVAAPPPTRLALVDDVLTTGATMNACAEALRLAGAARVCGLALARSRPDLA